MTPFWSGHESARIAARNADEQFQNQFDRIARWVVFTVFLCLAFAASCRAQAPRIADAERYYPDNKAAYAEAVACTGTKHPKPYDAIVWMRVPRPSFRDVAAPEEEGKLPNIGEWVSPDSIFVAAPYADSWVPKHEMIHYVRQKGDHPREVFGDACHATWGYLPADTTVSGPGTTIRGPAYPQ